MRSPAVRYLAFGTVRVFYSSHPPSLTPPASSDDVMFSESPSDTSSGDTVKRDELPSRSHPPCLTMHLAEPRRLSRVCTTIDIHVQRALLSADLYGRNTVKKKKNLGRESATQVCNSEAKRRTDLLSSYSTCSRAGFTDSVSSWATSGHVTSSTSSRAGLPSSESPSHSGMARIHLVELADRMRVWGVAW